MKKSRAVPGLLLSATAAGLLGGCGGETRRCVDQTGRLLPESACRGGSYGGGYYGGYRPIPRFVYGGSYSNGRVMNFSNTPRSSGFGGGSTRGGFGGRSFGGFS